MALSALSVARPLATILESYFYASRRPQIVLWLEWASLAGVVGAIATASRTSVNSACVAVGAVFILRTLAAMWVVCRRDGVAMRDFLVPMIRPVVAGIAMFAGVAAVRASLVVEAPAMQLVTEIGAGAAIYIGLAWLIARSSCDELVRAVRLVMTTS